jgi:endonuclease YncB( thermonuclease family)
MSGPDFHYPRRRAVRRRKPARSRRSTASSLRLAPLMAVAFLAALAGLQRMPGGAIADASDAIGMSIMDSAAPAAKDALSARFALCHSGGGSNCVVDGDTFWFAGDKYRIADIDTPETHPARCAEEAVLGAAATGRLHRWLNEGSFSLESAGRDADRYGRKLRIVTRGGTSVGSVLVAEGLARPWEGRRRPWCRA